MPFNERFAFHLIALDWQHTLAIWGDELVDSLGQELLTWLPRHAPGPL